MPAPKTSSCKVHQAVARAFFENGVETMFGLTGDANMYMANSYVRDCGGRFIAAATEAGATMMALGYATISGGPGVSSVTFGPGLTNTLTGLVEGVRGSLPLIVATGETPIEDRENAQRVLTRELAAYAGAGFEQIRSTRTVAEDVARVLRRAIVEHRPMIFSEPMDLDWSEAVDFQAVRYRIPDDRAVVSASEDLDNAIGIIASAKRPVILVGRGATSEKARRAILALARRIEAPLATSLKAKDLFRGEDFNLGLSGTISSPSAAETILESDCLIAFGASLNKYTLSHGTFLKNKRVIQVNTEPSEIGKNVFVDAGLVGEPASVAELIVHWLDEAEIAPSGRYTEELRQRLANDRPEVVGPFENGDGTVDYRQTLLRLDGILPKNRVVATDGGRFMIEAWKHISVDGPASFLAPVNFASIGLGLPHAIGASFAAPGRPVVLVTGDGGFMNGGLAEFNTAVRHKVDLIVAVCNDGSYGAEHHKFLARQLTPELVLFDWPDFAPVAISLGGEGVTVRSEQEWDGVKRAIDNRRKPLLVDIKLDPRRIPWDR